MVIEMVRKTAKGLALSTCMMSIARRPRRVLEAFNAQRSELLSYQVVKAHA